MHPISHVFLGWSVATATPLNQRDRTLVTLAGILPDIDGLGIVVELATWNSNNVLWWYHDYHYLVAHNLLCALMSAGLCLRFATQRWKTALIVFLSVHVHLLADLVGSGADDGYQWPIAYFFPLTKWTLTWKGQWELTAWPNVVITMLCIAHMFWGAWTNGCSPLEIISKRANTIFVETLRNRFPSKRFTAS
jgi:hypothetical protein